MKSIITTQLSLEKLVISFFLIALALFSVTTNLWAVITPFSLILATVIAFSLCFSPKSLKLIFAPPQAFLKNLGIVLPLPILWVTLATFLLLRGFNSQLAKFSFVHENLWQLVPRLLGEEMFSFFLLLVLASLLKRFAFAWPAANISCGIIFALLHLNNWQIGHSPLALLQVLLIQGVLRLIFNYAGLATNSIWLPFISHLCYDLVIFPFLHWLF